MVTCRAGSAVIINQKVFHGNFPNYSDRIRRMLAIAYRPTVGGSHRRRSGARPGEGGRSPSGRPEKIFQESQHAEHRFRSAEPPGQHGEACRGHFAWALGLIPG